MNIFCRQLSAVFPITVWIYCWGFCAIYAVNKYKLEYGGVLRQEIGSIQQTDPDIQAVIQFAVQFVKERSPWSLPTKGKTFLKSPQVTNSSKVNLIYTHDDRVPLYYQDSVRDKYGKQHGITSMYVLGTLYRLTLRWQQDAHIYTHNFTVSVPLDLKSVKRMFMYSHTFHVENLNITKTRTYRYLTSKQLRLVFESKFANSVYHIGESVHSGHMTNMDQSDGCLADQSDCAVGDQTEFEKPELKYLKAGSQLLKVMSYNIWNMNAKLSKPGGYVKRMEHLKKTIADADPDIIGLQEVRYEEEKGETLGPSQIHTLASWFPDYQFVYQPGQLQPVQSRTEEGVAILSRFPIVAHNYHLLFVNKSNSADQHQRVLLHAEIFIPLFGQFHVFVTHLSLSHEAREQSVVEIWQYMNTEEGPAILLGDLNAEPQEDAIKFRCILYVVWDLDHTARNHLFVWFLAGKDSLPVKTRSQLIDVWSLINRGRSLGYTFNTLEETLSKRIDYIYLKNTDQCCKVLDTKVLDDGTRGDQAASDHLPLQTTLSFYDVKQH